MPIKTPFGRPLPDAKVPRNGFDRGYDCSFSYNAGFIQCPFSEFVIGGSHVKLNRRIFQRTSQVNTAAFNRIDTVVDFVYVPLRVLWSRWEDFKLNIRDASPSTVVNQMTTITASGVAYDNAPVPYSFNFQQSIYAGATSDIAQGTIDWNYQNQASLDLLHQLRYLPYIKIEELENNRSSVVPNQNLFRICAYQKAYFDLYRNTAYEADDPMAYNMDYEFQQGGYNTTIESLVFNKRFRARQVNYRKDFFKAIYPALNYVTNIGSQTDQPTGNSWTLPSSLVGIVPNTAWTNLASVSPSDFYSVTVAGDPNRQQYSTRFTVQNIRAAFALDKLLRASAYAPKHVKNQIEARYGVHYPDRHDHAYKIGTFQNTLAIGEVTNTADSQYAALGQIGGKGVSADDFGRDLHFDVPEDGIIMALVYSMPYARYDASGIDLFNTKISREDFFIPEYMDLGLQPLYQYQNTLGGSASANNSIVGYQTRYSEYKSNYNRNYDEFNDGGALSDFVVHSNNSDNVATYSYFKVRPVDLDSIFTVQYSASSSTARQFITDMTFKFDAIQNMSVHGQPQL